MNYIEVEAFPLFCDGLFIDKFKLITKDGIVVFSIDLFFHGQVDIVGKGFASLFSRHTLVKHHSLGLFGETHQSDGYVDIIPGVLNAI